MGKRSIENRIESAENTMAFTESPDPKQEEIQRAMDAVDGECGEGAALEALGEVISCMFAKHRDDWSDIPSDLAEDSAFENPEERDRCAAKLAEVVFSSNESAGDSDDDGDGSALKRPPAGRAD